MTARWWALPSSMLAPIGKVREHGPVTARWWALPSSMLAPIAMIGGWTLAAALRADFDQTRDTISALAATGAPNMWVMTTGLAVVGACHIMTAAGFTGARPAGRVLLALGGVATAAVAALPQPATGHEAAAAIAFCALSLWPVAAAAPTKRSARLATAVLLICLAGFGLSLLTDLQVGLTERILAGAQVCWPLAAVLVARRGKRRLSR